MQCCFPSCFSCSSHPTFIKEYSPPYSGLDAQIMCLYFFNIENNMHVCSLRRTLEQKKTLTHCTASLWMTSKTCLQFTPLLFLFQTVCYIYLGNTSQNLTDFSRHRGVVVGGGVLKSTGVKVFRCDIYSCTLCKDVNRWLLQETFSVCVCECERQFAVCNQQVEICVSAADDSWEFQTEGSTHAP